MISFDSSVPDDARSVLTSVFEGCVGDLMSRTGFGASPRASVVFPERLKSPDHHGPLVPHLLVAGPRESWDSCSGVSAPWTWRTSMRERAEVCISQLMARYSALADALAEEVMET